MIGGDLNLLTTMVSPSLSPDRGNIDTFNLESIPNEKNSEIVTNWLEEGFCVDLFRINHPHKIEFSCLPFKKEYINNFYSFCSILKM